VPDLRTLPTDNLQVSAKFQLFAGLESRDPEVQVFPARATFRRLLDGWQWQRQPFGSGLGKGQKKVQGWKQALT